MFYSDAAGRKRVDFDGRPPGGFVYVFYEEAGQRAARLVGKVIAVLARPECIPDGNELSQAATIDGDSHIAICRPAVDIDAPGRSLHFRVYGETGVVCDVTGSANSAGRLGKLHVSGLDLNNPPDCERRALEFINPLLSQLSHQNGIPLLIWQLHVAPAGTTQVYVRVTRPFEAKRHGNRHDAFPIEYAHLSGAYREGMNLLDRSPLFAFLSFYKVFEGGRAIEERLRKVQIATREPQRIPLEDVDASAWIAGALGTAPLSGEMLDLWIPREVRGKSIGDTVDLIRKIRNRIAHGLVDPDAPSAGISSVDDPALMMAVQRWLPLIRTLASRTLNRSGLRNLPFGMRPNLALKEVREGLDGLKETLDVEGRGMNPAPDA